MCFWVIERIKHIFKACVIVWTHSHTHTHTQLDLSIWEQEEGGWVSFWDDDDDDDDGHSTHLPRVCDSWLLVKSVDRWCHVTVGVLFIIVHVTFIIVIWYICFNLFNLNYFSNIFHVFVYFFFVILFLLCYVLCNFTLLAWQNHVGSISVSSVDIYSGK